MKNAKAVLNGWFWAWALLAAILVAGMLIVGNDNQRAVNAMASAIMALMMVMPVRNWTARLIVWAIEYAASRSQSFRNRINKLATMNRLVDPSKREENVGFYRTLRWAISIIAIIIALLWLVFQRMSFQAVYGFLHTWEFIFTGKISFLALLIFILVSIVFGFLVYRVVRLVTHEGAFDTDGHILWRKAGVWLVVCIVALYGKILLDGILLKKTLSMIGATAIFWTAIILLIALIIFIVNHWPDDSGDTSSSSDSSSASSDDSDDGPDDEVIIIR